MIYPEVELEFPWIRRNARILSAFFFLLILAGAVCAFVFTSSGRTYPCAAYSSTSLASDVTSGCLQYLWTASGCKTAAPFPPGYAGWWNRSPAGSKTVSCANRVDAPSCGAGTYAAVITYMQLCTPWFTGP